MISLMTQKIYFNFVTTLIVVRFATPTQTNVRRPNVLRKESIDAHLTLAFGGFCSNWTASVQRQSMLTIALKVITPFEKFH